MAQQELDPLQLHPRFEEMGRKRMAEHMRVDRLGELRGLPGLPADQIHGLVVIGCMRGW